MNAGEIWLILLALSAGALSKGAVGMGLPLLALPLLAAFFSLPQAIAVLTIPIIASNAWQVWLYRAEWRGLPFLPALAAGGLAGLALGTLVLKYVDAELLEFALGLVLLGYIALRFFRPEVTLSMAAARRLALAVGLASGTVQGATGITSPLLVTYLHPIGLRREAFILALSTMFLLFAVTQIPALAFAGLLELEWLGQGLLALAPVVIVMPIGAALARWFGQTVFDRAILVFIAVMGARFVATGTGLI